MKPTKIKNVSATSSLNVVRRDVKYDLDRRLSPVQRIILDDPRSGNRWNRFRSDKKPERGPPPRVVNHKRVLRLMREDQPAELATDEVRVYDGFISHLLFYHLTG
jgi:hypothetical protein